MRAMTKTTSANTPEKKSTAPLCVLCDYPMTRGGYLRQQGKPGTYVPVDYCVNNECMRYGLITILKKPGTGAI